MEIKRPKIKSMKYEDFNDNEYLEQMVRELRENGTNAVSYTHLTLPTSDLV